jgi:hypothetical protein
MRRSALLAALALAALLAALPTATSSASFTSRSRNAPSTASSAPDWTPPQVSLAAPGDAIRGTVSLTASASDGETGVNRVVIAWSTDGVSWTTICTRTAQPYSCSFTTTGLPEDYIDLRAVATDNAGYSTTSVVEGVLVDNVAPIGSLGSIASPLSGTVTITATASDAGSGVGSVAVQYAPAGTTAWTTICTDTTAPYSCRFDTTTVADALYDFRAVITDVAGNSAVTTTIRNRQVDNRIASVSLEDPGPYLRGTETVNATASSTAGVASVRIQRALVGSSTWTDICTDTTAPYSCTWNTTTVADGDYQLRAILLDGANKTTTSAVSSPHRVDNSPVRGFDVQALNGGILGQVGPGDQVSFTYTREMRPGSLVAGWTGAPRPVAIRLRDGVGIGLTNSDDTIDVFTTSALSTPVQLGSVNLRGDYITKSKNAVFDGTMSQQSVMVNGQPATVVTVTFGAMVQGAAKTIRTISTSPTMVWTPSAAALDLDGIATSTAPVAEQGLADRDL